MEALSAITPVQFVGVGGRTMTAAGLRPWFDMSELTVMGLAEVVPRLPSLLRRIRETGSNVVAERPDALITIDSPDFTLRVARLARRELGDLRVIHYVAPSVWAWRPGRAAKMARYVDHVLALLPFEPPYMEAAGMTCDFVGHPIAGVPSPDAADALAFRTDRGIHPEQPVLLLAPGSRRGEVRRLIPIFIETIAALRRDRPDLAIVCPVAETVEAEVRAALAPLLPPAYLVLPVAGEVVKRRAFAASDVALCTSGTVTLELAAAGTPMVAAYRTNWLTAAIVRRLVRVGTANLVNLVTGRNDVPEFLQERCKAEFMAPVLAKLVEENSARAAQRRAFTEALDALGRGGMPPAQRAARSVLRAVQGASGPDEEPFYRMPRPDPS